MSNLSHSQPEYFAPQENNDQFWQYIQSLNPEAVSQLSKPNSPEVLELIQKSIVAMLGNLPHDRYNTMITTSRDELGKLLGSAMIDGYFLRNAEQRLEMEKNFQLVDFQ
ncbi:DUF760 domain-containing protein [Sphaerospermopsis kisseleviana CS-549]|jgi:hypothetical protein|uniref:DUF760 domain-containing protein n=3 Tax=Sphaerospermopsis TaxID=752201 RepID=A0A479ZWZ9_9CYAN|nr:MULTISPECIES: DUF760 domain-containing protein [Sphaerospermopsis]BAZ82233.1 hypothetical protein NIES73_35040 [Sphaerospermopsis kisseleviana NIES-73]MBD2135246.1 DUF760 domain-containing protein [Sphaerospermopsis sp. FACHB-1094]MBD2147898.1 DUF760 domain-containing protein [Sphaerospermopsis sp. FACHB-1194]MBE9237599.1 DUF760 domain-containing protein [Sphaerospermopsis aphanizomenoides LEGE 00250]MDB9444543.1 DUF760 domain-containing protein [Sphaerospermopsis kisseleviana CS-549]